MDKVKLEKSENIIDYVSAHADELKGRKIFTNKKMVDKLIKLTSEENILIHGRTMKLSLTDQQAKNLTIVEVVREGSDCYWLKDIVTKGMSMLDPVDIDKDPVHIVNEEVRVINF